MTMTTDVLIVGGGIAGVSLAARLAPERSVLVLEREEAIGYHATGRSAAVFLPNYGNAVLRALNAASRPLFENAEGFEGPLLKPRGQLMVADESEIAAFEAYLASVDGLGEIAPEDAVRLFPLLRCDRVARALYEPEARDIDVDRLLQGFARSLRAEGGLIATRADVRRIARANATWRVETSAGAFEAPVLVNAAGAWADEIAELAGIARLGLTPFRRSAALLPIETDPGGWPVVVSASENWYAKPDAGKLLVSPADEDPVDPHDAWPEDMVLAEGIDRFERMTTLRVTRVARSWAGLRTFAPDRTPVAGFSPEMEGFFWLAGQGGYGIQTAPALSRLAADLILGQESTLAPEAVAALDPGRFV